MAKERRIVNVWFSENRITVVETYAIGHGRYRRRKIGQWVTLGRGESDYLPDVLRAAAAELETPILERSRLQF